MDSNIAMHYTNNALSRIYMLTERCLSFTFFLSLSLSLTRQCAIISVSSDTGISAVILQFRDICGEFNSSIFISLPTVAANIANPLIVRTFIDTIFQLYSEDDHYRYKYGQIHSKHPLQPNSRYVHCDITVFCQRVRIHLELIQIQQSPVGIMRIRSCRKKVRDKCRQYTR